MTYLYIFDNQYFLYGFSILFLVVFFIGAIQGINQTTNENEGRRLAKAKKDKETAEHNLAVAKELNDYAKMRAKYTELELIILTRKIEFENQLRYTEHPVSRDILKARIEELEHMNKKLENESN